MYRLPTLPFLLHRLSLDSTEAELRSLFGRTSSLRDNVRRDGELCQQMGDFLQVCRCLQLSLLTLATWLVGFARQ